MRALQPKEPHDSTKLPTFIQRYLNGVSLQTIAKEEKVSREAIRKRIYQWTLTGRGDIQYADLVTTALVNRIAEADAALDSANEMVGIARARETARFSRMDYERRRPHLYGPKQEDSGSLVVKIPARLLDSFKAAVVVSSAESGPQPVVIDDQSEPIVMDSLEDNQ